jgi:hypothetical protein
MYGVVREALKKKRKQIKKDCRQFYGYYVNNSGFPGSTGVGLHSDVIREVILVGRKMLLNGCLMGITDCVSKTAPLYSRLPLEAKQCGSKNHFQLHRTIHEFESRADLYVSVHLCRKNTWKINATLSLCLINYALCRSVGIAPPILTSALDGGEWSASRPDRFNPGVRVPGTHWIGGRVVPRAGLDAGEQGKCLASAGNRTPAVQP